MGNLDRARQAAVELVRCRKGATAIEYGLIVSLVVVALVAGVSSLGGSTQQTWGNISNKVANVEP